MSSGRTGTGSTVLLDVTVLERRVLASEVVMITFGRADGAAMPNWQPGAHVELSLPSGASRQYSLCGLPADRSQLSIAVMLDPSSRGGSRWVWEELEEGTQVQISEPRNQFSLDESGRYLFIAGGIGITPILPMVRAAEAAGATWQLLYGGRQRASMAFAADLQEEYGERVQVVPQDESGLLDLDAVLSVPDPGCAVYACGPEPLLRAVEDRTQAWPSGALRVERFVAGSLASPSADKGAFVVRLTDGRQIPVKPEHSILETLRAAGLTLDSSCEGGTCGTCETRVLAGSPDHRDEVLTEEEMQADQTMMICVSRSHSPVLELDL